MNLVARARAERAEIADLLDTLTPEQWATPSLCAGWDVYDVVAHMISFEELDRVGLVRRFVAGRLRPGLVDPLGLDRSARDPAALVGRLRARLTPVGFTTWFGGAIGLVDAVVHHQDIRRPLGLPREVPEERLRPALRMALFAPPIRGVLRVRDVRAVATDIAWSFGRGPEVRGPAEALLMVIAGRPGVVGELSGPGVDRLAARV